MLIIAGELRVDPSERDRYLELTGSVAPLARSSPGCLDFVQSADPHEADRINVYERWDSDESLEAFRNLPSHADAPEPPALVSADVKKYRISGVEAP